MLILPKIIKTAEEYACITLYGARQTGKSTMIRNLFPEFEYVTLDKGNERILATDDPELFLASHNVPLIIDEIQKVPGLMESIKIRIDEAKLKSVNEETVLPLMYILTGSNTHEIRENASETLAGRQDDFRRFMRIMALRTSQQLDYTEIGYGRSFF